MNICHRLRRLREWKNLSQGDIEKRTGLLRCYISRVENGHTVPSVETLEKISRALEIPMYQLFIGVDDGEEPKLSLNGKRDRKGDRILARFRTLLPRMRESDRSLLLNTAMTMARIKTSTVQKHSGTLLDKNVATS